MRVLYGVVASMLLFAGIAQAECRLTWDASASVITGYRVYVSPDLQVIKDRSIAAIETTEAQILCTTVSLDLDDYAAVSAYDASGNESVLSNIVQRKDLVAPGNMKVRHFIEVTE